MPQPDWMRQLQSMPHVAGGGRPQNRTVLEMLQQNLFPWLARQAGAFGQMPGAFGRGVGDLGMTRERLATTPTELRGAYGQAPEGLSQGQIAQVRAAMAPVTSISPEVQDIVDRIAAPRKRNLQALESISGRNRAAMAGALRRAGGPQQPSLMAPDAVAPASMRYTRDLPEGFGIPGEEEEKEAARQEQRRVVADLMRRQAGPSFGRQPQAYRGSAGEYMTEALRNRDALYAEAERGEAADVGDLPRWPGAWVGGTRDEQSPEQKAELLANYQRSKLSAEELRANREETAMSRTKDRIRREAAVSQLAQMRGMGRRARMGQPVAMGMPGGGVGGGAPGAGGEDAMENALIRFGRTAEQKALGVRMRGDRLRREADTERLTAGEAGAQRRHDLAMGESRERGTLREAQLAEILQQGKRAEAAEAAAARKFEYQQRIDKATLHADTFRRWKEMEATDEEATEAADDAVAGAFPGQAAEPGVGQVPGPPAPGPPAPEPPRKLPRGSELRKQILEMATSEDAGTNLRKIIPALARRLDFSDPIQRKFVRDALAQVGFGDAELQDELHEASPLEWSYLKRGVNWGYPETRQPWGDPITWAMFGEKKHKTKSRQDFAVQTRLLLGIKKPAPIARQRGRTWGFPK